MVHKPVLLNEVVELLDPKTGENFIDATFGGGGHSRAIWEKIRPSGRLLAVDWNKSAIIACRQITSSQDVICAEGNFADLPLIMAKKNFPKADGLLLDLGVSSDELENSGRGFSFRKDEPLLMTYSDEQKPVRDFLQKLSEKELADIIKNFSQEKFAGRIARTIKRNQPMRTTKDLVRAIAQAVPKNYEKGRIHPATRTFMALRIYANKELDNLQSVLGNLEKILAPKGRAAIISFHSLEDRLVKQRFSQLAKEGKAEILNKKPVTASPEEIKNNLRARSAKLRVAKLL